MKKPVSMEAMEKELRRRVRLEKMLTAISTQAVAAGSLREFLPYCLQTIGRAMNVSRSYVFEQRHDTERMDNTFEWTAAGIIPHKETLQGLDPHDFPWCMAKMRRKDIIDFKRIDDIPCEAERAFFRRRQVKSLLAVPIFLNSQYVGFMGLDECRRYRQWRPEDINILLTVSQITAGLIEREKSHEALLFERGQLLSIFESIDQIIYVADPHTYEILFVNQAARKGTHRKLVGGLCYKEFQGRKAPCEFCTNEIILKQKYQTYKWEFTNPFLKKDFILIDRIIKWPDGRDVRFEIAIDITDRKKAEKALAESEEKYRQLFEMESDAIFLIDNATGNLLEANAACESLYGYSRGQLLQMKNTDLSAEPQATRKATKSGLTNVPIRYHRNRQGDVFPVEITARHFVWHGSGAHVAAIRDITSRLEAEKEKSRLERHLRQMQKMESLGTLAGGIAHDFNNILSAIMGYTEVARFGLPPDGSAHQNLGEVLKASQRAKSLVAQILAFTRETKSEFGPVQTRTILEEVCKMLRATLPASIRIESYIHSQGWVLADPGQIHQILMNLCTNAYHAMRQNGGTLRIRLCERLVDQAVAVRLNGIEPGPYQELAVSDDGIGMDQATLGRIFDPYFTTKPKGEGTGLGLAITYGIVQAHNGAIAVESEPGKGASFLVYLPMMDHSLQLEAADASPCSQA